jgi:hypothetical protein
VSATDGGHPVWLFWEAINKQATPPVRPYLDVLYKMYCMRWNAADKSKKAILVAALVMVCESGIDTTPVVGNTLAVSNVLGQMSRWIDAIQRMQQSFST